MISLALIFISSIQGFSDEGAARITAQAQNWTFNFNAIMGEYPSRNALENAAHDCILAPNDVCVVVDPSHRWTSVHFGKATNVPKADFNAISAAGNSYFKNKDFAGGVVAIGNSAMNSVTNAQALAAQRQTQQTQTTQIQTATTSSDNSAIWLTFLVIILAALVVWAFVYLARRQKRLDAEMDSYREERNEFLDANVNRILEDKPKPSPFGRSAPIRDLTANDVKTVMRPHAPAPIPPQTVHHHHNSNDNFVTGMIVGNVLSNPAPTRVVEREVVRETPKESSRSSWGSSNSSDDSSSSSWDSGGGGSDWGGGSDDSGGGGSDW